MYSIGFRDAAATDVQPHVRNSRYAVVQREPGRVTGVGRKDVPHFEQGDVLATRREVERRFTADLPAADHGHALPYVAETPEAILRRNDILSVRAGDADDERIRAPKKCTALVSRYQ
jgi:hypothetical protein